MAPAEVQSLRQLLGDDLCLASASSVPNSYTFPVSLSAFSFPNKGRGRKKRDTIIGNVYQRNGTTNPAGGYLLADSLGLTLTESGQHPPRARTCCARAWSF
jgi:hypothetical protein